MQMNCSGKEKANIIHAPRFPPRGRKADVLLVTG